MKEESTAGGRLRDHRLWGRGTELAAAESDDERVNGDSFCERHADDGDHQNVTEGTGIAAHCLSSTEANEANADTSTSTGNTEGEGTIESTG